MTDRELDERIAKALSANSHTYDPRFYVSDGAGGVCLSADFSPATSVDALRKWVLPEIQERGMMIAFLNRCLREHDANYSETEMPSAWFILCCEPSTLAAAALAVLEEDNG